MDEGQLRRRIGARLRAARNEAGLSQMGLSARSSVSTVHISFLERGEKSGSVEVLHKLARALGVRLSALIDDEANPSAKKAQRPEQQLAVLVEQLARGSDEEKIETFKRVAKAYFSASARRPRKGRKRS